MNRYQPRIPTASALGVHQLDPPYAGTKGMYFGGIDLQKFFDWLRDVKCRWILSFDGRTDKEDLTYAVPEDIYARHEYLKSGNSSFRRVIGKDRHASVEESVYLNYSFRNPTEVFNPEQLDLF